MRGADQGVTRAVGVPDPVGAGTQGNDSQGGCSW